MVTVLFKMDNCSEPLTIPVSFISVLGFRPFLHYRHTGHCYCPIQRANDCVTANRTHLNTLPLLRRVIPAREISPFLLKNKKPCHVSNIITLETITRGIVVEKSSRKATIAQLWPQNHHTITKDITVHPFEKNVKTGFALTQSTPLLTLSSIMWHGHHEKPRDGTSDLMTNVCMLEHSKCSFSMPNFAVGYITGCSLLKYTVYVISIPVGFTEVTLYG